MTSTLMLAAVFLAAVATTRAVRDIARRAQLVDRPNARSSHATPTPRLGGIGIVVPAVAAALFLTRGPGGGQLATVLGATAAIALVGLVDDVRSLPARWRFVVHVLAAAAVVLSRRNEIGWVFAPLDALLPVPVLAAGAILWIVWVTNLYNFMDGIDGLAGGQAVIASVAVAAAAFGGGATTTGWLMLFLAAAAAGFLVFNFPPASIFMGDVGSTTIGFLLACVPFMPEARPVPIELVGVALSLFILDGTVTLLRRVARGERWFEAHRTHYYQRPVAAGMSHRTVTLVAYGAMILVAASAVAYPVAVREMRFLLVLLPVLIFLALATTVHALEWRASRRVANAEARER